MTKITKAVQTGSVKRHCEGNGEIWIVSIDNPPANTLTQEIFGRLQEEITLFEKDVQSRVLIITGTGQWAFVGGVSVQEILKIDSTEEIVRWAKKVHHFCNSVEKMDKPVIAAINSLCIGGGNEIALACHFRIASENAKFSQPEINMGFIPGFGGTQRLPKLIGISKARKMILTGETIDSQEAFRIGLVDLVVSKNEFLNEVVEFAKRLASRGQTSIRMAQKAIRAGYSAPSARGISIELECFKKVCQTEDMKEGLKAFVERRKPNFRDK